MKGLPSSKNSEKLIFAGQPTGSLGSIEFTVVQHGQQIFAAVPKYGKGIQAVWTKDSSSW